MRDTSTSIILAPPIAVQVDSDTLLSELCQALQDLDIVSSRVHSLTEALALQSAASMQSIPVAVRVPTPLAILFCVVVASVVVTSFPSGRK